MNKLKITKFSFLILIITFFSQNVFSNTLFGGIEIGSKGVKVTILDVENAKNNIFKQKEFWTENVGIAKGISINGSLNLEDIEKAGNVVLANYNKLLKEFKIEDKNIFIVASSGVGMANNTDVLVAKIKELTNKDLEIISSKLESKLLFRGCISQKNYNNSLLIDIGGGNTKGGFVEIHNGNVNVFHPMNLDLGTMTLTERINKQLEGDYDMLLYKEKLAENNAFVNNAVKNMFLERPEFSKKKNIYLSGGAVWAFVTLSQIKSKDDNFIEFKYEDVLKFATKLINNYGEFSDLADTDKEVERVLKTYSQKHLFAGCSLLLKSLENINDLDNKKIYFIKQGQAAWIMSYVADSAKGSKVIY